METCHPDKKKITTLKRAVWAHYKRAGRHDLPWRQTVDPYRILVSELMLQQTQVARVIPKYLVFLARFPTIDTLAQTPLREVLIVWQGLGYNRRAKMLHEAAQVVVHEHAGQMPRTYDALLRLPGVGPYTARAVCAFAYNESGAMVETNIRTVLFHHLYPTRADVSDAELYRLIDTLCPAGRAREWYWALMDYGAHLKAHGVRLNHKSKHYTKQSKFEGSDRQLRGAILRAMTRYGVCTTRDIVHNVQREQKNTAPGRIRALCAQLRAENLIPTKNQRVAMR